MVDQLVLPVRIRILYVFSFTFSLSVSDKTAMTGSKEYVSPVGDSVGKTKVLLYNPNDQQIDISIDYLEGGTTRKTVVTAVSPGKAVLSHVIPTGSGAWFNATKNYIALSLTDTEFTTSTGQKTGGQWYDWGFPVMPRNMLTSQVLVSTILSACVP
jgi:hypothetical protein